eukprot:m.84765 g.84765  ORF g.84765 m.84765 type:complete len:83 (-) comp11328_c0_seq1:855-1103(-)
MPCEAVANAARSNGGIPVIVVRDKTTLEAAGFRSDRGKPAQAVTVIVPDGVTTIGRGAFEYASGITSPQLPNLRSEDVGSHL